MHWSIRRRRQDEGRMSLASADFSGDSYGEAVPTTPPSWIHGGLSSWGDVERTPTTSAVVVSDLVVVVDSCFGF